MIEGCLHSIETLGSLDGPGLRTVFFLQGCNMECLYCHNRDSWTVGNGELYTVVDIISMVQSYREYYGDEGGVTFSGGEPLLQSRFLIEVIKELKKINIHTVLDTSGSLFNDETKELFQLADLIILDLKHIHKEKYRDICSYDGDNAFHNLNFLQNSENSYWIRQVIVEGYTDDFRHIEELGTVLRKGHCPEKIELLPYHKMGRDKWISSCGFYPLEGIKPPTAEKMSQLKTRLYNSFTVSRK